jgi:hypothetical protein
MNITDYGHEDKRFLTSKKGDLSVNNYILAHFREDIIIPTLTASKSTGDHLEDTQGNAGNNFHQSFQLAA